MKVKPELLALFAITSAIENHDVLAAFWMLLAYLTATEFPFEALRPRRRATREQENQE